MGGRISPDHSRRKRRVAPSLEGLEGRELMAVSAQLSPLGQFLHPLGAFQAPGEAAPRGGRPSASVSPHRAINRAITPVFGPGTGQVIRAAEFGEVQTSNPLASRIMNDPFIYHVFSRDETFRLLKSEAVAQAYTFGGEVSIPTEITVVAPPSTISDVINLQREVTITGGGGTGITIVVPSTIPILNAGNGIQIMRIPTNLIPAEALQLLLHDNNGSQIFSGIGRDILAGLESSIPVQTPAAAETVPGLRLIQSYTSQNPFPNWGQTPYGRYLRIMGGKRLLDLNAQQQQLVQDRISDFYSEVRDLNDSGAFNTPDPIAVDLPAGKLQGTLQVSFSALKEFFLNGDSQIDGLDRVSGLNIPGILDTASTIGFPGRFDAGFVIDRAGNYGIYLSVRNAASNTIPGQQEANKIAGETAVTVSNARRLADLNGLRGTESLSIGSTLSGGLTATSGNGVQTFGASVGYGAGLEFGTGVSYTKVIPLGNVNSPRIR